MRQVTLVTGLTYETVPLTTDRIEMIKRASNVPIRDIKNEHAALVDADRYVPERVTVTPVAFRWRYPDHLPRPSTIGTTTHIKEDRCFEGEVYIALSPEVEEILGMSFDTLIADANTTRAANEALRERNHKLGTKYEALKINNLMDKTNLEIYAVEMNKIKRAGFWTRLWYAFTKEKFWE